jgi:hypothetical protein
MLDNFRTSMIAIVVTVAAAQAQQQDRTAPAHDASLRRDAIAYLDSHYQPPEDYVVSKFQSHDFVFLGEAAHGVRQNLLFLQRLIPRLYMAGIRNLGYEMVLSDEQAELDNLINAPVYDETKALTLLFHWDAQYGWAYQEYADVIRAAWNLNHRLPKGAPRFRIVGTDLRPDWSLVKPGIEIGSRLTRWKAWAGSNQVARNVWMYSVIRHEFADKGLKALLFNGVGHTPLYPTLDAREETGLRFSAAYQLFRRIGDRVTSVVCLSGAAQNPVIADIMAQVAPQHRMAGFDLKGTPIGNIPLPDRIAGTILTEKKNLTFADYMGGVVFLSSNPEPIAIVSGFITEARVEQAKKEGWLPVVPEITVGWILQHAETLRKLIVPARTSDTPK